MRINRVLIATLATTTFMTASAVAGGFSRGTADTDLLYEEGNFNMRAGVTIVAPTREFSRHGNPALVGTSYTDTYAVPSAAIKLDIGQYFACAATLAQPYGGATTYDFPTLSGKVDEDFTIYEFGATCAAKLDVGPGKLYLIGGIFQEQFDYERRNLSPIGPLTLSLSGEDVGFRGGVGYQIPDIALKAELMYRAGTDYGADGTLTGPAGVFGIPLPDPTTPVTLDALGVGELPQSVELKLQSGVAPGWLVFGSVKWTDWSVTTTLDVISAATGTLLSQNQYFWRDGWTVTGGVGHAFTENVSGAVSLTWDRGVGTGWDLSSDTWTLGAGGSFKNQYGGELRAGMGVSYLTSAEETQYAPAVLNSAVDSGWAVAFSGSYKVKW